MQSDFRGWINEVGIERLSAATGASANTIYSWTHRNHIPYKFWPEIVLTFSELGLNDLRAMRSASKPETEA